MCGKDTTVNGSLMNPIQRIRTIIIKIKEDYDVVLLHDDMMDNQEQTSDSLVITKEYV